MSVYVQYDEWGRMGNRMFQYAFAYLLAKQRNVPLISPGLPNFNIPPNYKDSNLTAMPIFTRSYGDNYVDMNELMTTKRDIVVDSFVQKSQYYIPHRNVLRNLFSIEDNVINKGKLMVHIRETDYIGLNKFLGFDYYYNTIKQSGFNFKDVILATDNSNCETIKRLLKEGCTLNSEGYVNTFNPVSDSRSMNDFNTLLQSENIALSQSSFSWWAAFLGNHKTIIFPEKEGMWKLNPGKDDVDLRFSL